MSHKLEFYSISEALLAKITEALKANYRMRFKSQSATGKMPKNSGFFISEDFPKSVSFNRKKMLPIFHKALVSFQALILIKLLNTIYFSSEL